MSDSLNAFPLLGDPERKELGSVFDLETHFLIVSNSPLSIANFKNIVSKDPNEYTDHCPGFALAFQRYGDNLPGCSGVVEKSDPIMID